jgi:DNA-binding response OmpR family regulator
MVKKILIIDDEEAIRAGFQEIFKNRGFEVKTAAFGTEACDVAKKYKPDIVILDYYLSDHLSGLEVCKFIRSKSELTHAKIIMITGVLAKKQAHEMMRFGFDKVLMKPIQGSELLDEVYNLN